MTPGSRLNMEIESACAHYRLCVLPRNPKRLAVSVWSMPDPSYHAGVIWRVNSGAARLGRSFVRFGPPGLADYAGWLFPGASTLYGGGRLLQIEGKAGKDRLSGDQVALHKLGRETGVLIGSVSSYDECCTFLEHLGLKRPG